MEKNKTSIIIFSTLVILAIIMFSVLAYWMVTDKNLDGNHVNQGHNQEILINDIEAEQRVVISQDIDNRILLIVMEDNSVVLPSMKDNYTENEFLTKLALSFLFSVKITELDGKTFPEIIDDYGEDYLAGQFKEAAKGYSEIIVLSDEDASFDNFVKVLKDLNNKEKMIDIVLDVHGLSDIYYFYGQLVNKNVLLDEFDSPLNIGFVYQTVCYGGQGAKLWLDLGAEVVSGAKGINSFVLLSPQIFLSSWVNGDEYYDAVQEGFNHEIDIFSYINKFISNDFFATDKNAIENSTMMFYGNKEYSL
jgi:hypothetical protein